MNTEKIKLALDGGGLYEITGRIEDIDKCIVHRSVLVQLLENHIPDATKMVSGVKDSLTTQQEQGESVAWYREEDGEKIYYATKAWDDCLPLYTTPQQSKVDKHTDDLCQVLIQKTHIQERQIAELQAQLVAQPKQEPVAWMYPDALCDRNCLYLCTKGFTQFPECATTSQQQKPLTDEQLKPHIQIAMKYYGYDETKYGLTTTSGFVWLARAIEAAHGIKENT